MPRDGTGQYQQPYPDVSPDTTIESLVYNGFVADVVQDLNLPRPISSGGTGGSSVEEAMENLGAETASKLVTNFDSHVWAPGSFRAAASATGAPVAGHAFSGWVYSSDALASPPTNLNVIVEARDLNDTQVPGTLYTREKKAGVWGPWKSTTLDLITYVEGRIIVSDAPPSPPQDSTLWWESDTGRLYIRYNDGVGAAQWVSVSQMGLAGPTGATGATGPTGATGATGATGPSSVVRYDVGGAPFKDIAVPAGSTGVRFSGAIFPGSSAAQTVLIQLSLVAGVFRTGADYKLYSQVHNSLTLTSIGGNQDTPQSGMVLVGSTDNPSVPMQFDGYLTLKRPSTSTVFTGTSRGVTYLLANGYQTGTYTTLLLGAAGPELSVLALRFTNSIAVNWLANSYITVEFF